MAAANLAQRAAAIAAQARSYADARGATVPAEPPAETRERRCHWFVWEPERTLRVISDEPRTAPEMLELYPLATHAFPWFDA